MRRLSERSAYQREALISEWRLFLSECETVRLLLENGIYLRTDS